MADLVRVRHWADALIRLHLDESWSFGFDNARTRAGLCRYDRKRISVSRLLAARFEDDEIHQVLLHEVAHALAGPRAGHGPRWKSIARDLGYAGSRVHHNSASDELAPWIGHCPAGHPHYRYRRPTREVSCARCSRRFDLRHRITWARRGVPRS
ncbi:MAG: SprT-like domain-containing protein [Schumannella sp.]|nr:SprT-like domain-containing protein [Microbacteriaceae bacterium]